MRWKNLLILALSAVLFLFLSYKVGDRLMEQHRPPPFATLDSYLRTAAAAGDWKFDSHTYRSYRGAMPGWWSRFGIRRYANYDQDNYLFQNTLTTEIVLISVWRENGKVVNYHFSGSSVPAETLKDAIVRKFPPLGRPLQAVRAGKP